MNSVTQTSPLKTTRSLAGKVALVTGSTSGIGLAVLEKLAAEGADVVMNGFGDPGSIEAIRSGLEQRYSVRVRYDGADMSKPEEIEAMVEAARRALGALDILVNNAGIQHVEPIERFPVEKWNAILAINLSAAFHTIRASLAGMKARGWGRIVNIASAHALIGSPFKSAYVAAKHGVLGLTKVAALEGAEHGVTANAICPGYVWTPLVEKQIEEQAAAHKIGKDQVVREVLLKNTPTRTFAEAGEIGALAAFLCGPHSGAITGTALPVDGGWTAH
ncbi:3-hydroxybutyrate dehydrogenase [Dongia sedimenti]|uniref:3-hydroxybutyrate dehydrogenase n=1 Tax=Dongia sedimenti TaxID=3064282 RepID=A0ABU0YKV3_9PROT|nr:3-hydroxybutyrate dehydrogenase [Rhodospirillaceae bacterium R-7]